MGDAELLALKAAFSVATKWSEVATIVVAIGVAIEFLALFVFGKKMSRSEKIVMAGATLLIVMGCVGEYIYGSRATSAAQQLQNISDKQIADTIAIAGKLGVSFGNLDQFVKDKSKEFDAATDKLKQVTRDLNVARDEAIKAEQAAEKVLANVRQDRNLTDEQIATLAEKLKHFTSQEYRLTVPMGDPHEPHALALKIISALFLSGWKQLPSNSMVSPGVEGVFINIRPDAQKSTEQAAKTLVETLNSDEIQTKLSRNKDLDSPIDISVGAKP